MEGRNEAEIQQAMHKALITRVMRGLGYKPEKRQKLLNYLTDNEECALNVKYIINPKNNIDFFVVNLVTSDSSHIKFDLPPLSAIKRKVV